MVKLCTLCGGQMLTEPARSVICRPCVRAAAADLVPAVGGRSQVAGRRLLRELRAVQASAPVPAGVGG